MGPTPAFVVARLADVAVEFVVLGGADMYDALPFESPRPPPGIVVAPDVVEDERKSPATDDAAELLCTPLETWFRTLTRTRRYLELLQAGLLLPTTEAASLVGQAILSLMHCLPQNAAGSAGGLCELAKFRHFEVQ